MSLIKCPECGREVSDKANSCPNCGYPIADYVAQQEEIEQLKEQFFCKCCGFQNELGVNYCENCGMRITEYTQKPKINLGKIKDEPIRSEFNGIYKYSLFGGKQEVYCPRCGSDNCAHYQEQRVIPGKTKTRYTANLNPLRPFTLVNKKEKVVRKEQTVTESKFVCNSCGKIFN